VGEAAWRNVTPRRAAASVNVTGDGARGAAAAGALARGPLS
jgi:hypothetical protein